MKENQLNHYHLLHGGELFKKMDVLAGMVGENYTRRHVVTRSANEINFYKSSKLGDTLFLTGEIEYTGNTSLDIFVEVRNKTDQNLVASGLFTMVKLDEDGKPARVEKYTPKTEEEQKVFRIGEKRRENYLKIDKLRSRNYGED